MNTRLCTRFGVIFFKILIKIIYIKWQLKTEFGRTDPEHTNNPLVER